MDLLQLTPEAERTCIKDILPRSSKSIGFFLTKQIELANAGTSTNQNTIISLRGNMK